MEERKMILKMLDEGKISSAEAVELLKAVGENDIGEEKQPVRTAKVNYSGQKEQTNEQKTGSTNQQQKTHNTHTYEKKSEQSTISKFSSLIDRVVTKLKDTDFDFNFGQAVEIDHVFQENDVDFNRLKVHVTNGGIQLHPWEEQSVRVECHVSVYRTQSTEEAKAYFLKNAHFATESGELQFLVDENRLKVQAHMYVPTKMYEQIQLRTANGAITLDELQTDRMIVRTTNGAVTLNRVDGGSLNASTSNGKIRLDQSNWKKLDLETLNGAIRLNGKYEDVEAETLNGSINFTLEDAMPGKASFKTVAGKIEILVPDSLRVDGNMKATIGSLNCFLDKVDIKKETKDVVLKRMEFIANEEAPTTYEIEAVAKTGSISIAKR
ncbi:DUF4097 domain-containing protein [Bacillus sp. Marseille-Q3570]|uniref:DUF4097 family beta strand repeat-containing protein n=1 Tax=Bacillus sp. Marseille-Q3570 TaxID=2963522 RepID=UPI0021B7DCC8|nr:DUF4097 domain-containing protein [Bacillus sp. Marseille-Q3570]